MLTDKTNEQTNDRQTNRNDQITPPWRSNYGISLLDPTTSKSVVIKAHGVQDLYADLSKIMEFSDYKSELAAYRCIDFDRSEWIFVRKGSIDRRAAGMA